MGSTNGEEPIPFWNMNIPQTMHTATCPPFLKYAYENEKDRGILSMPDSEYHRLSWPEVRDLIRDNRIDLFQRVPSDLRRYREYCAKLAREYGSVLEFVQQERLGWKGLEGSNGEAFTHEDDYKILLNDWPYGIDERIVHIVVWTKFELVSDPDTDDLTPQAREEIDAFVQKTFVEPCGEKNVIWFKNWASLKSVHAVEHLHVMIFDPPKNFVNEITGGDVSLAEKVGYGGAVKEMKASN